MIITYENLLRISDYQLHPCKKLTDLHFFNFLSFQDAVHYLIKAYQLQGKKVLLPVFYCDATIKDLEKHGLQVHLCQIDYKNFDVDMTDFQSKLRSEQPDIIIVYNFFGKNSQLYNDRAWLQQLKPGAFIISDFAHSLIPNHNIEFLNERHFYIDSTRKTTSQMMAHLIMPKGTTINKAFIVDYSRFKLGIRILFFLKSWCLWFATFFNMKFFSTLGTWFYILHDNSIGSPQAAFSGFGWDSFLYHHINFKKIRNHRCLLYQEYKKKLGPLAHQGHIELFNLPAEEEKNICFFFFRIIQEGSVADILKFLQDHGYWAEVLWNFDAIKNMSHQDREWAKSIVVLPYTIRTTPHHIKGIATLLETFFNTRRSADST